MAELTIHLERDAESGRQMLTVRLAQDPEELPHEHEPRHRDLVSRLLAPGVFRAALARLDEGDGRLTVEREKSAFVYVPC
jgi:hypothetical protein